MIKRLKYTLFFMLVVNMVNASNTHLSDEEIIAKQARVQKEIDEITTLSQQSDFKVPTPFSKMMEDHFQQQLNALTAFYKEIEKTTNVEQELSAIQRTYNFLSSSACY